MKTAVVICPGRGTYNAAELGYLSRHCDTALLDGFDAQRRAAGQVPLAELDGAERFSLAQHTRGDNASALIYAATLGDFAAIDRNAIEIVAITGNSMGWYSALACASATTAQDGFIIANTMGILMQKALIGGQTVYPFLDENWQPNPAHKVELLALVQHIDGEADQALALSIDLGGMLVLAGNEAGLAAFEAAVPRIADRFPLRLANHAAFHTAMQEPVAQQGRKALSLDLFGQSVVPLIDGRGSIWWPHAVDAAALREYTLRPQVTQTFDFTRAITVAAREFAPDLFIVTGPGTTLGSAVAQSLILADWRGLTDRAAFKTRQADAPLLVSMGLPEQRSTVT